MIEQAVVTAQDEHMRRVEEATERLAWFYRREGRLYHRETLESVARDSVRRIEEVDRAVTGHQRTVYGGVEEADPLTAYVREMLAGERSRKALAAPYRRGGDGLNVNHFMQEVVATLGSMVKKRVKLRIVPADREVRVMADREKMRQVVASIVAYGSEIVRRGGTITLLARTLPIENDLLERGKGRCALLSVVSTDVSPGRSGRSRNAVRHAVRAISSVIGTYHGSIRILRERSVARFNIYLPLLQGT